MHFSKLLPTSCDILMVMTKARAVMASSFLAFAACDSGVVIEVRTTTAATADTVELFLAHEQVCDPSEPMACAIQPPGAASRLPGYIYTRDEVASFTQPVGPDGSARFRIEPGAVDSLVPLFIAIGTSAGAPTSAMLVARAEPIDAAGPLKLVVELAPADGELGASPVGPASAVEHVQLWTQPDVPHSTCLAFERYDDGGDVVRKFIVPADDPDCDSVTTAEKMGCERVAGAGTVGNTPPEAATCVGTVLDAPGNGACALGARSCDLDASMSCVGGQLCVPRGVCDRCGDATSLAGAAKCLIADTSTGMVAPPRLVCTVHFEANVNTAGTVDRYTACSADAYSLHLKGFRDGCETPRFGRLETGSVVTSEGEVDLTPAAAMGQDVFKLRTEVTSAGHGCDMDLTIEGSLSATAMAPPRAPTETVTMRVDPTDPATHGLGFPLVVRGVIGGACGEALPFACVWTTMSDPMFDCPN